MKRKITSFILACMLLCTGTLVSCKDNGTSTPTEDTTQAAPVDTVGEELDPYTTVSEHSNGKVVYKKYVTKKDHTVYPDDMVGKYAAPELSSVKTLHTSTFENTTILMDETATVSREKNARIKDGKLYFPCKSDSLEISGENTWSPIVENGFDDYKQLMFSINWDNITATEAPSKSPMIGCYLNKYTRTPEKAKTGLWFAFNETTNTIRVYHPRENNWPDGWASVPVTAGLMADVHTVEIICTPDFSTYVYITPANGNEAQLVCSVLFSDEKIRVYDSANGLISESDCEANVLRGSYYTVYGRDGGGAVIEEVNVYGCCTKQETTESSKIIATPTEGNSIGLDITDKTGIVSICYSVWFDAILGKGTKPVTDWNNVSEVLAGERDWGKLHAFHYWSKPALGYYRSSDKSVIRTHMTQLAEAGVDYITIDWTNARDYYFDSSAWDEYVQTPMDAMLETIMEMRYEGLDTPYVVFWVGQSDGPLYEALYERYHAADKWKDCFVYWDGKPLMLVIGDITEKFPRDLFTVRSMWGLKTKYDPDQWSFLCIDNSKHTAVDANGNPEQMTVAVAAQETYMSQPTAHGREGGMFWFKQWYNAFKVRPKVITLTWWNEWTAQRFDVEGLKGPQFVDNYTQEYSRDIEPMEGGHGDQYYQWLKQYVSDYKNGKDCPILVEENRMILAERWVNKQK